MLLSTLHTTKYNSKTLFRMNTEQVMSSFKDLADSHLGQHLENHTFQEDKLW